MTAWSEKGEWQNGPLHGFVLVHRNTGTTAEPKYAAPFKVLAGDKPVDTLAVPRQTSRTSMAMGDLDLLCGEFLDGFTYFQNIGTRTKPDYGPALRLAQKNGEPLKMDLEMIVPDCFDWDRDGDLI